MSALKQKEYKKGSPKEFRQEKQQQNKKRTNDNNNNKKKSYKSKIKKTTQITNPLTYNVKKMKFEEVIESDIPNAKVPGKIYRIPIYTENEDKTNGDLVLEFGELMCFGLSVNINPNTGEPNGHSMALSLLSKDNPTDEEKMRVSKLEQIVERAKEYLIEHRKEVKQNELEMRDLKKFTPLYYKKDADGNRIDGPPTLYPKLLEQKARIVKKVNEDGVEEENEQPGKILTVFYDVDENGEPKLDEKGEPVELNPARLIDTFCKVKPLIKVESMFVGTSIKLQVKIHEADVKLLQRSTRRLLHNNKSETKLPDKVEKLNTNEKNNENTDNNELNLDRENTDKNVNDNRKKTSPPKKKNSPKKSPKKNPKKKEN